MSFHLTPLLHFLGIVSIPFNTPIPRKIFVTLHFLFDIQRSQHGFEDVQGCAFSDEASQSADSYPSAQLLSKCEQRTVTE